MLSVKKLNELNFSRALMALLLLDSVGRLIPAGTGATKIRYQKTADSRDAALSEEVKKEESKIVTPPQ